MDVLLTLLIAVVVAGLFFWIVQMIPLPQPMKQIAQVLVVLMLLLWILNIVGVLGTTWRVRM